jgi:hypothetical protein
MQVSILIDWVKYKLFGRDIAIYTMGKKGGDHPSSPVSPLKPPPHIAKRELEFVVN